MEITGEVQAAIGDNSSSSGELRTATAYDGQSNSSSRLLGQLRDAVSLRQYLLPFSVNGSRLAVAMASCKASDGSRRRLASSFSTAAELGSGVLPLLASKQQLFFHEPRVRRRAAAFNASGACRRHRPPRFSSPFGKRRRASSPVCGDGERTSPFRLSRPAKQVTAVAEGCGGDGVSVK
nr:hypothetical protein Iba_chr04bCG15440 [Ipomoea batatas]